MQPGWIEAISYSRRIGLRFAIRELRLGWLSGNSDAGVISAWIRSAHQRETSPGPTSRLGSQRDHRSACICSSDHGC
jgi:hypothetical protein